MTVSFGHAAHLTAVWLPQLTPTTGKAVSTLIAIVAMSVILTGVAALFALFCLEKSFSWIKMVATFVASLAVIGLCGGGLQHITRTNTVHGATPADSRASAIDAARDAASPESSWRESARAVSAQGRRVQQGWTKKDLQKISSAVATAQGMHLGYPGAPAVLDTAHQSKDSIAQHGTTYFKGKEKVRCVVTLKNVTKNNVGQPVTAEIDQVRCVPAASPAKSS